MESKHTPGPWKAEIHCVWGGTNGDRYVAGTGTGIGEKEQKANARLIAAAPDLLAELEAACLFAEKEATRLSIECNMGASEWESFVPPWFGPSRDAIAKARGE